MVYLYLCAACQMNNHGHCEIGHPAPPGHYGGSLCQCGCRGNPKWNDPKTIHKELWDTINKLGDFEKKSLRDFLKSSVSKTKPKKSRKPVVKGELINGQDLKFAAKNKLPVYYVEEYYDPQKKHMNFRGKCILKRIRGTSYYIGKSDIDLSEYTDTAYVHGEFAEGNFAVYKVIGIKYN